MSDWDFPWDKPGQPPGENLDPGYGLTYDQSLKLKENQLREKYGAWIDQFQGILDAGMPEAPDYTPWIQSIGSLTSQLAGGPQQFVDEATRYRAEMMGYQDITNPDGSVTTAEQQYQNDLQQRRGANIEDMQGLSAEERAMMEKSKASAIEGMEEQAQRALEAVMGNRGGMGALAAADEYRKQISDVNLQYDLGIYEADYAKKKAEIERNDQQYALQIQQGNALASDYLNMRRQGFVDAISGYMQQAALATQEYQNQINEITTHANLIYQAAMLDIGADESIMSQLSEYWEQMIAPELLEMQRQQFEAAQQAQEQAQWMGWLGLGIDVLSLVLAPFTAGASLMGLAVGEAIRTSGGASEGSGETQYA